MCFVILRAVLCEYRLFFFSLPKAESSLLNDRYIHHVLKRSVPIKDSSCVTALSKNSYFVEHLQVVRLILYLFFNIFVLKKSSIVWDVIIRIEAHLGEVFVLQKNFLIALLCISLRMFFHIYFIIRWELWLWKAYLSREQKTWKKILTQMFSYKKKKKKK